MVPILPHPTSRERAAERVLRFFHTLLPLLSVLSLLALVLLYATGVLPANGGAA